MKVNLTLTINNELFDVTLERFEHENKYFWRMEPDINIGKDYNLEIVTKKGSSEIESYKISSKLIQYKSDIFNQFHEILLQISLESQIEESDGIEPVNEETYDFVNNQDEITIPYDPKLIRVDPKYFSILETYRMMESGQLDIDPEFQRNFVWTDVTRKSRLIESILLRIPLPVFYLSENNEGVYQVVDGLQRFTVIKSFMKNEFKLKNLEYLEDCEGKFFNKESIQNDRNLLPAYKRRIEGTMLYFNVIDSQTPDSVRYEIFKRINTGGKPLNKQEVRNCLSSKSTRKFLSDLSTSHEFLIATRASVSTIRMADKELILRFVAFYLLDNNLNPERTDYKGGMDVLLDETISVLNNLDKKYFPKIEKSFFKAMNNAYLLFGENAFKKASFINKALFLSLSRTLYNFNIPTSPDQDFVNNATRIIKNEIEKNKEYQDSLSLGTNDANNILIAFDTAKKIIKECLK